VPEGGAPPLQRERDLGRLLDDTFGIYRRHLGVVLLLAAGVVLPVELLISGVGLGQLTGGYRSSVGNGEVIFDGLVPALLTTPLVTGMLARVVLDDAAGEAVSVRRSVRTGLDAFAPMLVAVLLAAAGIALGLLAFVIPGVFLFVRWYVVAPAVVIEGRRGGQALRRSSELAAGRGWWVLGVVIVVGLITGIAGTVVSLPADVLARSADAEGIALAGTIAGQILTLPFSALATLLLFFTLRARRGEAGAPPSAPPPPPGGWEPPVPPR
jgi:hypothetical protein